jgi:hypothetical protein
MIVGSVLMSHIWLCTMYIGSEDLQLHGFEGSYNTGER